MAIICQSTDAWLVDHRHYIDGIYLNCQDLTEISRDISQVHLEVRDDNQSCSGKVDENRACCFKLSETLFDIQDQYRMDSWFRKHAQKPSQVTKDVEEEVSIEPKVLRNEDYSVTPLKMISHFVNYNQQRRKRKRGPVVMNEGLQAAQDRHIQIRDVIVRATKEILFLADKSDYFKTENKVSSNNREARELAKSLEESGPPFAEWCHMAKCFTANEEQIIDLDLLGEGDGDLPSLVNILIKHRGSTSTIRRLMGENYLLPPQAAFLMSDISNMAPLVAEGTQYDLVVMDPPWGNKSVKRKRSYRELRDEDLLQLPVVAAPGALLVVWTTNRTAHHTFVTESLFPRWGAVRVATWYWVKVTQKGEFVTDIDDPHGKRPYETLLLGRVGDVRDDVDVTSRPPEVPDQKVIVSVPCSVHSSKPPLQDVLRPYLPEGCRRLELFARSLQPGWTSWGNEALKFQHERCYHKVGVT